MLNTPNSKWEYLFVDVAKSYFYEVGHTFTIHLGEKELIITNQPTEHSPAFYTFLNELGEQGWELAGTVSENNLRFSLIFKRPKV